MVWSRGEVIHVWDWFTIPGPIPANMGFFDAMHTIHVWCSRAHHHRHGAAHGRRVQACRVQPGRHVRQDAAAPARGDADDARAAHGRIPFLIALELGIDLRARAHRALRRLPARLRAARQQRIARARGRRDLRARACGSSRAARPGARPSPRPRSPRSRAPSSCVQSRKRQCSANAATSAKVVSMPPLRPRASRARACRAYRSAPRRSANSISWRARRRVAAAVVVAQARDRLHVAPEQPVRERRLADARRADEADGAARRMCSRNSSRPSPVAALARTTGTPIAARSIASSSGSRSASRSTLLSTTTGSAPLFQTAVT